jgi:pyrroloquinoline quinone (PQQ) biosynthesis protein C
VRAPVLSRRLGERLLAVMDCKHHPAYTRLTVPGLGRDQLLIHFRHEYLVYVRDFPILLARVLGEVPPLGDVRRSLAENLYEEQTGGLSRSGPHPELFLEMMAGLGFGASRFDDDDASLHPDALAYRDFLRVRSVMPPWQAAVALLTIFVEGSVNERAELAGTFVRKRGDEAVLAHPLVVHYGCPPEAMRLTRAHADVEGAHRADAWRIVLDHTRDEGTVADAVVTTLEEARERWLLYRDGVTRRMGISG